MSAAGGGGGGGGSGVPLRMDMSSDEVKRWIEGLGSGYAATANLFHSKGVSGDVLLSLDDATLSQYVTDPLERRKITLAITDYHKRPVGAAPATAGGGGGGSFHPHYQVPSTPPPQYYPRPFSSAPPPQRRYVPEPKLLSKPIPPIPPLPGTDRIASRLSAAPARSSHRNISANVCWCVGVLVYR